MKKPSQVLPTLRGRDHLANSRLKASSTEGDNLILHQKITSATLFGTANPARGADLGGALGSVTKNSSTVYVDTSTGEVKPLKRGRDESYTFVTTPQQSRSNRWALKSVVNTLYPSNTRVCRCMRDRAQITGQGLAPIEVVKGQKHKKAFYQGLMACGSVWTCPICAAKIAERRRVEVREAIDNATTKGYAVHFVTLTIPHGIGDDFHELLGGLRGALKRMSSGMYAVKSQLKDSMIGYIRVLEVTHGRNGWHPHYHILLFTEPSVTTEQVKAIYAPSWQRACRLAGLPIPSDKHGCTVQNGAKASDYVSKWGLEDEMTKAHMKTAKQKGMSPFGLLRCILDGDDPDYTPERAKGLFLLYAHAMKGSRQLHWSVKLRDKLDVGQEVSDEALVELAEDERATLIGELTVEQWRAVRRAKAEAALLDAAESHPDAFYGLLAHLVDRAEFQREIPLGRAEARDTKTDGGAGGVGAGASARLGSPPLSE